MLSSKTKTKKYVYVDVQNNFIIKFIPLADISDFNVNVKRDSKGNPIMIVHFNVMLQEKRLTLYASTEAYNPVLGHKLLV